MTASTRAKHLKKKKKKKMLFIKTKHMPIFEVIPFIKLQNDT